MSTVVQFNPNKAPAFAKKRGELSAVAKALMGGGGGGGGGGKRISIKGGVFRLLADGKEIASIEDRHLDVVIANAAADIGRTFYAGAYDPEKSAAPDCWSADGNTPSVEAKNPQSKTCATCPQNVKGSGSGESRACKFSQRLAVVLESDMGGDVLQLQVPAASLFGQAESENMPLKAYANWLGAQNISPDEVVTRMKFDTKAQSPKLFFRPVRWLDDDEHDIVLEKGSSEEAKKAVTMTVAKTDKAPDAPVLEAPKKPKAKEPVEDDVDEPEVRQEKASPAPNKRNNLASVVADWDTDD
jgi:hypothetical protein